MSFWRSLFGKPSAPAAPLLETESVRVLGAMSAYFKQPDGPSRPGVDWKMMLPATPGTVFFVRTLAASDPVSAQEETLLMHQAVDFVLAKLSSGWTPEPFEMLAAVS